MKVLVLPFIRYNRWLAYSVRTLDYKIEVA
jgi:hypothetical protein